MATEKMILVMSMSSKLENGGVLAGQSERGYPILEFHMVDLKGDKVHPHCAPSLVEFVSSTTTVALDHSVYVFGGLDKYIVKSPVFKLVQSQSDKFFFGGSRFDLEKGVVWGQAPFPIRTRFSPICTSLLGKIYNFGCRNFEPEVLDPRVGHWKPLRPVPPELAGASLSCVALPDPSNRRVLLHLSGGHLSIPSLYAFSPLDHSHSSGGTWKCIAPGFPSWTEAAAVVDGVLYSHSHVFPSLLYAIDIASGTELKPVWSSCFEDNVDMNNIEMNFDALLPLGDGILCFAVWSPIYPSDEKPDTENQISFLKFRVERNGKTINLIPIISRTYELPSTCSVSEFLSV